MAVHAVIVWKRPSIRAKRPWFTAAFVLVGMLFGYYWVYLLSPYDLESHVVSSSNRLLLQLWPTALLLYCAIVAPRTVAREQSIGRSGALLRVAAIVLIVAVTALAQFSNRAQPIPRNGPPHLELSRTDVTAGQSYTIKITGVDGPQVFITYSIDDKPMGQFGAFLGSDGTVTFEVSEGTPKGVYRFHTVRSALDPSWMPFDNTAELTLK
jgi:hypothetical protein